MIQIESENLFKIDEEILDNYILDLQEILNASDNWDEDLYWSLPLIIENLSDGHFDIVLDEKDDSLFIFGVYIDEIDKQTKSILIEEEADERHK